MVYQLKQAVSLKKIMAELKIPCHSDEDVTITNIAPFDKIILGSLSFSKTVKNTDFPCAVLIPDTEEISSATQGKFIASKNPRLDFIRLLDYLNKYIGFSHFDFESEIHPSVLMGKNVVIERGCKISEGVILEHNVVIHSGTSIGKNTRIRANSAVGGDGFGFERLPDGTPIRFIHLGGVQIGENVEIGSLNSVVRGALSDTIIENNVKTDNLVHIAHNCFIGEGTFITACAELSGGVITGKNVWIGPNTSFMQKITIAENAFIGLGAVVTKSVEENAVYAGNPAKFIRSQIK